MESQALHRFDKFEAWAALNRPRESRLTYELLGQPLSFLGRCHHALEVLMLADDLECVDILESRLCEGDLWVWQ